MKKIILLFIVLFLCSACANNKQPEPQTNKDYITIENHTGKQQLENIVIDDILITFDGRVTTYKALVISNINDNNISNIAITFYQDDQKIITLYAPVDKILKENETYQLKTSADQDLSRANKIEYQVIYND